MQEPSRPRRKKPNVQEHRDPAIVEEGRLRLLELQRHLRSKIAELPGPRVFGLEVPQTRGWLETPSGVGQLKPQDLDRVLLMLEALDLLFLDLIGGANLFQCPRCGTARWHLYIPRFRLICRDCAGLTYKSRREPNGMKLWREWDKISARLGGVRFDECYGMAKPKGMHSTTFESLRLRLFRIERVIERELHHSFRR